MILPVDYTKLHWAERSLVRDRHMEKQGGGFMKTLPFESKIEENVLTVTYKDYKITKTIGLPEIMNNGRENIFENETLKSAKQLNIMMFGKKNYPSKAGVIPMQLRKDTGSIYTLYFKRPISGEIQKYDIKYVIGVSEGIEFITEDNKNGVNYGQLIFIESKINHL